MADNPKRILIIEDEPVHLNVMRSKLEREGYEVADAIDGEAGFEAIKKENPDLVLLDVILPKLDGFGVLEKMKEAGLKNPVIIVSNSGQPVEIDRAMKLGARDFLVKAEFNPADVVEKVEAVLGVNHVSQKPVNGYNREIAPKTMNNGENTKKNGGMPQKNAGARILVVEDDKFLRDLIVQKLKKEGFVVFEGVDGEEGLKAVRKELPDLILLDLILPGLDGFEVLRQLKAGDETKAIPVIVLSNLGQKEDIDRATSIGAEDFMIKAHFTPSEIIEKIKSIIKKKYF